MTRPRTIVGLGESFLIEHPDRAEAAGLALSVAQHATRLGHAGIPITRIGQDGPATRLLEILREADVLVDHIQHDPDLPTGRSIMRAIGGPVARYVDERTAFDNLQWDFDLEDVAQQADGVLCGLITRRTGQARSEENRFLAACKSAVTLLDATNRIGEQPDRSQLLTGLEHADAVTVDQAALNAILPASTDEPIAEVARRLMREHQLAFLLSLSDAQSDQRSVDLLMPDVHHTASIPVDRPPLIAFQTLLLLSLLLGRSPADGLRAAARYAGDIARAPTGEPPADWMTW